MGNGIHSGGRRHRRRHGLGKFRIGDYLVSYDLIVYDHVFADCLGICKRYYIRNLAGSSCRCRYRDQRQHLILYQSDSAILSDRPRVGHQYIYRLCQVNAAASAHCHEDVDLFFLRQQRCLFHDFIGGIGDYAVKHGDFCVGFFYLRKYFFCNACHLNACIVDHHHALSLIFL